MLRALAERDLFPDLIVGTSAGALNGALLAEEHLGAAARLTELWLSFDRRSLIPDRPGTRLRNLAGRRHLYSDEGLRALIRAYVHSETFAQLGTAFACVATDLDSGEPVVLDSGPLVTALLATCAIPGVFPMVLRDGRHLADGLCVANIPVRQALDLGAGSIIALNGRTNIQPARGRRDVKDVVSAAFAAALAQQSRADLEFAAARVPTIVMPGQPPGRLKAFHFGATAAVIEDAYRASRDFLESIGVQRAVRWIADLPAPGER
jgi:NTE family protein